MNNMTNIMTNNMDLNFDFEICQLDQLVQLSSSPLVLETIETNYYFQTLSFCLASIITLSTMLYNHFTKSKKGLKFHFIGLSPPQPFTKSQYQLLPNLNTDETMLTLQTDLDCTNTIADLKKLVKHTYNISDENDVLILYSHHIISDENDTLSQHNITDNSLLTLAICEQSTVIPPTDVNYEPPKPEIIPEIVESDYESEDESSDNNGDVINGLFQMYEDYESEPEPVEDVNELFGMFQGCDSDGDIEEIEGSPEPITYPRMGFDIITQESNVLVHKMPCGHEMNHESLYSYALSNFSEKSNMHLRCPHSIHTSDTAIDERCDTKWHYSSITDVLKYKETPQNPSKLDQISHFLGRTQTDETEWINTAKLELLASRNVIENDGNFQKCPRCYTLYFRNSQNRRSIDEIKTVEDIANEFKFECVMCSDYTEESIERIDLRPPTETDEKCEREEKGHNEDDIIEDINGDEVNALFGYANDYDSDEDSDSEPECEWEEQKEALLNISKMFDDDGIDYYEIKTVKKLNEFCYCCGAQWEDEHVCDSSFKEDLCEILSMAELKTIGSVADVPSIRCCPGCCQLIFHVDACKHMQCRGCKLNFCFVCMKPKKDGSWQCGSHSDKCPVAPAQDMDTLPDTIVITKKSFQLYESSGSTKN